MTRTYQPKYLPNGSLNPKYRPDVRSGDSHKDKGDRHLNKDDRHASDGDRHTGRKKDTFIAIDGEGVTCPDGRHEYVLLMSSTGEKVVNVDGLSTFECFEFLLDLAKKYPQGIFVCYGSSYDVNMMLKDVPKEVLLELQEGKDNGPGRRPTDFYIDERRYALSYRQRKSFTVRVFGEPLFNEKEITTKYGFKDYERKPNYEASLTLWDVSGFFQGRFVDVLGDKKTGYFREYVNEELNDDDGLWHEIIEWPDGLRIDLTKMKDMKNRRSVFMPYELESDIVPYCHDELQALVRLMNSLRQYLNEAEIPLINWDGAGSCAGAVLRKMNVKESMCEQLPDECYQAQRRAYSGGRGELGKFGVFIGKVFNYDLHSAFPSVMPTLPCLTNGMWRKVRGLSKRPYSLTHVRWSFNYDLNFFPFFYRTMKGSIYYPPEGEGWYYRPEIDAALKAWNEGKLSTDRNPGKMEFLESWEFQPYSDVKPFAFVRDLYETRKRWKDEVNPAEKVLKFTINSMYGKLAQSLGWSTNKSGEVVKPPYHNIGYAGYITSAIRAKMFDALMQAGDDTIMVVSDGIYSTKPLDLPLGDDMGQWECKELDGMVVVQYGVYWGLKSLGREPTEREMQSESYFHKYWLYDGEWFKCNPHYQGYDRDNLTIDAIVNAWNNPPPNAELLVPSTRFVTTGSALASDELWQHWRTWRTIKRSVKLMPIGKRMMVGRSDYRNPSNDIARAQPHNSLVPTYAHAPVELTVGHMPSNPYNFRWDPDEGYDVLDGIDGEIVAAELMESGM